MKLAAFLSEVQRKTPKKELVEIIERAYDCNLSIEAERVFSFSENQIFFEEKYFMKLLSIEEIIDASVDMNVDFMQLRIIPIIDTGDNDYISYSIDSNTWCRFNIVDEIIFDEKDTLACLLDEKEN